jgi:hypothetical protein
VNSRLVLPRSRTARRRPTTPTIPTTAPTLSAGSRPRQDQQYQGYDDASAWRGRLRDAAQQSAEPAAHHARRRVLRAAAHQGELPAGEPVVPLLRRGPRRRALRLGVPPGHAQGRLLLLHLCRRRRPGHHHPTTLLPPARPRRRRPPRLPAPPRQQGRRQVQAQQVDKDRIHRHGVPPPRLLRQASNKVPFLVPCGVSKVHLHPLALLRPVRRRRGSPRPAGVQLRTTTDVKERGHALPRRGPDKPVGGAVLAGRPEGSRRLSVRLAPVVATGQSLPIEACVSVRVPAAPSVQSASHARSSTAPCSIQCPLQCAPVPENEISYSNTVFVLVVLVASNCHCRDTSCTPAFIAGTLCLLLPVVANAYVLSMITTRAGSSRAPKLSVSSRRFPARSEMEFRTNNTGSDGVTVHLRSCSPAVFRLTSGRRPKIIFSTVLISTVVYYCR